MTLSSKPIRFLVDESCDFIAVRALRTAGYDVVSVAESFPSTSDFDVLKAALHSERVLLTEDKDFGDWVFAHGEQITGVVLIRFPASVRKRISRRRGGRVRGEASQSCLKDISHSAGFASSCIYSDLTI